MEINLDEITSVLMQQINRYELEIEVANKGIVPMWAMASRINLRRTSGELLEFPESYRHGLKP